MMNATQKIAKAAGALALAVSCVALVGCNTVSGAGQDLKAGGNKMSQEAQKVKNDHSDTQTPAPSNTRSSSY